MLFDYVSLVCLCAEPSLLAMHSRFVMMNSDYVSLLSVQLSLLVMKLSYGISVIICFLLSANVSLDSSSAENEKRVAVCKQDACSASCVRMQYKICPMKS